MSYWSIRDGLNFPWLQLIKCPLQGWTYRFNASSAEITIPFNYSFRCCSSVSLPWNNLKQMFAKVMNFSSMYNKSHHDGWGFSAGCFLSKYFWTSKRFDMIQALSTANMFFIQLGKLHQKMSWNYVVGEGAKQVDEAGLEIRFWERLKNHLVHPTQTCELQTIFKIYQTVSFALVS